MPPPKWKRRPAGGGASKEYAIAGAIDSSKSTETDLLSQSVVDPVAYPILSRHWGLASAELADIGGS
jgi:hypothetical protein